MCACEEVSARMFPATLFKVIQNWKCLDHPVVEGWWGRRKLHILF